MMHPDTELKMISPSIGYGIFATAFIPKGTIVYVKDPLETEVTPLEFESLPPDYQQIADKYSYIDENGVRILSWDLAKYINHCCECNTMSSGFGFEIAIKDIAPGDEVTDEYGLFNLEEKMELECGCANCRGVITPNDIDLYHEKWDAKILDALAYIIDVKQPLMSFMTPVAHNELKSYLSGKIPYKSVKTLKYNRENVASAVEVQMMEA